MSNMRVEITYAGQVQVVDIPAAKVDALMARVEPAARLAVLKNYLDNVAVFATGNWIKVEATNRQDSRVRRIADMCNQLAALVDDEFDKQGQITAAGTDFTGMETEYNLQPGQGSEVYTLQGSLQNELEAIPFFNQYRSRMG